MMISRKAAMSTVAALSILTGASAALADVTPEQVWADWKGYMTAAGYRVDATESRSGNTLSVADVTLHMAIPEQDGSLAMTVGDIDFVDRGDGTVAIEIPPDMPIRILVDGPGNDDADIGLTYETRGLAITVSGDPAELTYTYSAASVGLRLSSIVAEGKPVDLDQLGEAWVRVAKLAGTTEMSNGNLRRSKQKLTTGEASYLVDFRDPEGKGGRLVMRGGADGLDLRGDVALPQGMDPADVAQMLRAGFALDATLAYENGASEINFKDAEKVAQGKSSATSGSLRIAMSEDGLHYAGSSEGLEVMIAGSDVPIPIEIAMEKGGFNLRFPVMARDGEQRFEAGVTLAGFTMSDMIWGIFDPAGKLPRDPATLVVDMAGTLRLFVDLLDPAQMEKIDSGEVMPGEVHALELRNLTLRAVGAELTGSGAFTFDNTDLTTFDGVPAPTGEVNLRLVGGNALLDTLVSMGVLPEDQAMGMRMMMGLFAVPGDGPDTLTSKIEVKGNGQILANGQRLK